MTRLIFVLLLFAAASYARDIQFWDVQRKGANFFANIPVEKRFQDAAKACSKLGLYSKPNPLWEVLKRDLGNNLESALTDLPCRDTDPGFAFSCNSRYLQVLT